MYMSTVWSGPVTPVTLKSRHILSASSVALQYKPTIVYRRRTGGRLRMDRDAVNRGAKRKQESNGNGANVALPSNIYFSVACLRDSFPPSWVVLPLRPRFLVLGAAQIGVGERHLQNSGDY